MNRAFGDSIFDVNSIAYDDFFQDGGGRYYSGFPFQRGFTQFPYHMGTGRRGFNQVLDAVMNRFLIPNVKKYGVPLLMKAGKELGREGLETGARVLMDVASGAPLKDALMEEGKEGVGNIIRRAKNTNWRRKFAKLKGDGRRKKRVSHRKKKHTRRSVKFIPLQKNKADILGRFK